MEQIPRFCGVALVIGFFLPFISMGPISCSGLDLVKMGGESNPADEMFGDMGDLGGLGDSEGTSSSSSGGDDSPPSWQLLILALIPIAGLVSAIAHKKPIYLICGAIPCLIFTIHIVGSEGGIFKALGVGAWLCIAASIAMLCTASRLPSAAMAGADEGAGLDPGGMDDD